MQLISSALIQVCHAVDWEADQDSDFQKVSRSPISSHRQSKYIRENGIIPCQLPEHWLAQLPDEILLEDDGLQPPTIKLAPVDQALVSPISEEEEEEKVGHDSPELTDQLLKLVEDRIIDRLKKTMEELVIPEWKVKLVQSYDWPKYQ